MSRNGHFALHDSLATAYAPNAERSAEGDILGVSAYDLSGLREDDASVRMGVSAYDLSRARRLGVSAYDLSGLGVSAYDLAGLREDDASVRMGDTNFDGATGSAEGSAEGHAVAQMGVLVSDGRIGGMVEDHYNVRMGVSAYDLSGLREDDANMRLGGLREDDASVRMGVSAYDLSGLREDDASVRMGTTKYGNRYGTEYRNLPYRGRHYGTEYTKLPGWLLRMRAKRAMGTAYAVDASGSAEDPSGRAGMGDVDDMGAEAWAIEQHGKIAGLTANFRMGYILRGLREDDAEVRMGVSAYDLGRRRAFTYQVSGAETYPPAMLAAEGFHERFPVDVSIRGLGRITMGAMTWSEAMPRIQTAIQQEAALMNRISRLNDTAKAAVLAQVENLNNADGRKGQLFHGWGQAQFYGSILNSYLAGGEAHWTQHTGTERRLKDTEVVIPTVDQMVSAYERGASPDQAVNAAINDVNKKLADIKKGGIMDYAVPIGAGVVGAGLLTALVLTVAK